MEAPHVQLPSHGTTLNSGSNSRSSSATLSKAQWELIEICVRASQLLGAPRSVGEIFGYLFARKSAVSFEQVVEALGISAGSASHGLRYLRRLGAVNVVLRARERRDFFQAETSLEKIITGVVSETAFFHLGGITDRLEKLRAQATESGDNHADEISDRLNLLLDWSQKTKTALALALKAIS